MDDAKTYYYAAFFPGEERSVQPFLDIGANEEQIFIDALDNPKSERKAYVGLKENELKYGDALVVKSLHEFGPSKDAIKKELLYFKAHHIRVKVIELPTTMKDYGEGQEWIANMMADLVIATLANLSERERIDVAKKREQGVAKAKAQGVHFGRPALQKPDNWDEVYSSWKKKEITAKEAMARTGLKRASFYKLVASEE